MNNKNNFQEYKQEELPIAVIGAGLTGLTTAFALQEKDRKVMILERQKRTGGQIHTFQEKGYTFESGPNTGVISYPEIQELFTKLQNDCELETAHEAAKCRMIWKNGKFHALPCGLVGSISTPLFTMWDKMRILGEPFRKKGTDPNEPVGMLAQRRLGKSFFKYAVDPFLSGVYAGDPMKLITKYALPKLYNLEQNYGSFIRGAIAKSKEPKTERDRMATKKVFSAKGGLGKLTEALTRKIGTENIVLGAENITIYPEAGKWKINYIDEKEEIHTFYCSGIISTVGSYSLKKMLPFVPDTQMEKITNMRYAPVVQISVGIKNPAPKLRPAFGGLVPTCEQQPVLGILFPSDCFNKRAPHGCSLYSFFMGGIRHPEYIDMTDEELTEKVTNMLHTMLGMDKNAKPDVIRIFRHGKAIPQYEKSSGERFKTITAIEKSFPGLTLAGNIIGGIGMADRIRQAFKTAERY